VLVRGRGVEIKVCWTAPFGTDCLDEQKDDCGEWGVEAFMRAADGNRMNTGFHAK
jgi:hypothetical protein